MKKALIILSAIALIGSTHAAAQAHKPIELVEYYADSLSIGNKGYNKVELSIFRDTVEYKDSVYIQFYSKLPNEKWHLKQVFQFETTDAIHYRGITLNDFNNDGFNDLTYISLLGAKGANEIRKVFIYDKNTDELIYLKNSEDYPNMQYNAALDCIESHLYYSCQSIVLLHIEGDRLKVFAKNEICDDEE